MPMLACIHHVSWVIPVAGGKHQCLYCKELVEKKKLYPKFEDLGPEYQAAWDRHEKGEAPPAAGSAASTGPATASTAPGAVGATPAKG